MKVLLHKLLVYRDKHEAAYFYAAQRNFTGKYAGFVGLNLFQPGYTNTNFIFIWSVSWIVVFILINFYTVILRIEDGLLMTLICATTVGMAFQGLGKVYLFGVNHKSLAEKINIGLERYNDLKRPEIKIIARNYAFICYIFYVFIIQACYVIAIGTALLFPVFYNFLRTGIIVLPVDIQLPFLSREGQGFVIHYVYLVVCAVMEFVGTLCGDSFYSILLLNAVTQLENIIVEIKALNVSIEEQENPSNSKNVSEHLTAIVKLHQIYIDYITFIVENFEMYFTANVVTMVYQIVLCLYINFNDRTWILGYLLVFAGTVQLLFTCTMGTLLEIKHDELLLSVNEIHWYRLSFHDRKELIVLLQATQRYHDLQYVFGKLDIQVFVEIYKKIYSSFTMLVNTAQ